MVSGDTPGLTDPSVPAEAQLENSLRTLTLPKQLEFMLNTQSTLQGLDAHFEVLTLAQPGGHPLFFSYHFVPDLVKKYHIDLVLMMANSFEPFYLDYFEKPLNLEGVPVADVDGEFLLKPYSQRIPPGAPSDFYKRCKKNNLIQEVTPTQWNFPSYIDLLKTGDSLLRR